MLATTRALRDGTHPARLEWPPPAAAEGSQAMVKDDVAIVLLAIMLVVMYKTYVLFA